MIYDDRNVRKIVVGLAIEHTLLKINKNLLDKVENIIWKRYHCSIADCYDHPDYINQVLKEIFGSSYSEVVKSVEKYLEEFKNEYVIEKFLEKINQ
jgi:hypothetical protein